MLKPLRLFAIITVLAACSWGACHAAKVRQLQESKDGPICIPHQICPAR